MRDAWRDGAGQRRLEAHVLGGCTLRYRGAPLPEGAFKRRRALTLLLLLLSRPERRVTRKQALEVLWPDKKAGESESGLRVVLSDLRAAFGESAPFSPIIGRGLLIALQPDIEVVIDADSFESEARAAVRNRTLEQLRQAAALYGGEFLPDRPYDDWAMERRAYLSRLHEQVLALLAALERRADPAAAEDYLRALLRADPTDEAAAGRLMQVLADEGRRSEALRVYQALAAALRDDLAVEPSQSIAHVRAKLIGHSIPVVVDHTPPQPHDAPRQLTNLPAIQSSFVGRDWELAELKGLLTQPPSGCRLITLTGPGGCGKTRLALAAATTMLPLFPDGVWFVDLASLSDATPVPQLIATILGVRKHEVTSLDDVARAIDCRRLLLVLDNCEHIVDAMAALVTVLLRACPQLHVLATSREPLAILGEVTRLVPPLSLPHSRSSGGDARVADAIHSPAALLRYGAIRLFVERGRAGCAAFTLTDRNAALVEEICRRLDGMPLAIELAAARLGTLALEELAAGLDDRFRLLENRSRRAHERHRTLRAVMDWSYALLEEPEQVVLQRLSIFVGDWTLDAAEVVCADDALSAGVVAQHLLRLVDKSLVSMDDLARHPTRYRLLETVRQYARDRLHASSAASMLAVQARHARWCLALAERSEPALAGPEQVEVLARLEADHGNLRAALEWSFAHPERADTAARLVAALWRFWELRGHWTAAQRWLTRALTLRDHISPYLLARILSAASTLALNQTDVERAMRLLDETLAAQRAVGDTFGIAGSLHKLALAHQYRGDFQRAIALYQESLALKRELGDVRGMASTHNNLGVIANNCHDYDEALRRFSESQALWRGVGDLVNVAYSLNNTGVLLRRHGDMEGAIARYEESLALFRQLGEQWGIAASLNNMGLVARQQGAFGRAEALYRESLLIWRGMGDKQRSIESLEEWADLAGCVGQPARAVRLFAAADAQRQALGIPMAPADQATHTPIQAAVREALDQDRFLWADTEGRAMTLGEAIEYAVGEAPEPPNVARSGIADTVASWPAPDL